jgi:hypothetical protein
MNQRCYLIIMLVIRAGPLALGRCLPPARTSAQTAAYLDRQALALRDGSRDDLAAIGEVPYTQSRQFSIRQQARLRRWHRWSIPTAQARLSLISLFAFYPMRAQSMGVAHWQFIG